jgi:HSP20 family protein
MYVARYNPMREIEKFRKGFDSFNIFLDNFVEKKRGTGIVDFEPLVNTREGKHAYHVELDLPGMKKEDITVDVKDNAISISGERKIKDEIKEGDYYRVESSYGKFERSFSLPENVDIENIHANSEDGVLEVVIPKFEKKVNKPKTIEIK